MEQNNELKLFEDKKIRAKWNDEQEKWYFSVVDIVAALTDNDYQGGRKYWKTLKMRLNKEGSELVTNCYQLKMQSSDGKYYNTDVMTTEQILRLIQSIPSKKVEPLKLWLAQVGKERIDEAYDPEIAINRALDTYRKKGYSEEWINQRLKTIDIRKEFTDELKEKGITLIALVLTIIVLLILAGVSISMLTGDNGIISQAQRAKEMTEASSEEEYIQLLVVGYNTDKKTYGDGWYYLKPEDVKDYKLKNSYIIDYETGEYIKYNENKHTIVTNELLCISDGLVYSEDPQEYEKWRFMGRCNIT